MDNKNETKIGINIDKLEKGVWSFGICLSKWYEELYIYINIFRWSIVIGKIYKTEVDSIDKAVQEIRRLVK